MTDNNAPRSPSGKLEGWSAGGTLNPKGTKNPSPKGQASIHLQCELDRAAVFTVQFSTTPPKVSGFNGNVPVALVKFSVAGVTTQRKISVYNGATISGCGQVCEVEAFDESTDVARSAAYDVAVTVTPGTRGGTTTPTLQNSADQTIAAGASHDFNIERDVGAVLVRFDIGPTVVSGTIDPSKFVIQFLDESGSTLATVQDPTDWVVIPPNTFDVDIINNGAISADVRMVLGIDG
jgi:hypothetical protein